MRLRMCISSCLQEQHYFACKMNPVPCFSSKVSHCNKLFAPKSLLKKKINRISSSTEQTSWNCSAQTARMTHTSLKVCCLFSAVATLCSENSRCSEWWEETRSEAHTPTTGTSGPADTTPEPATLRSAFLLERSERKHAKQRKAMTHTLSLSLLPPTHTAADYRTNTAGHFTLSVSSLSAKTTV